MAIGATVSELDSPGVTAPDNARRPLPVLRRVGGLARGLPNHWFPILPSSDLRAAPVRLRRFGEDLAVWRDRAGAPHVFPDRCPHRGAPLSQGHIRGDTLCCAYHGWTFDGTGKCIEVPLGEALGDKLPGLMQRANLASYPAQDRAGYIWAFYGEAAKATPLTGVPYELEDARWSAFRQQYVWNTNWINILDNIFDPLHALFLHVGVATQLKRAKLTRFAITEDFAEGFRLAKMGVLADGSTGEETPVEFLLPAIFRIDLADGTPRGLFRVVMIPTPIDEHSTFLFYIQARRVSGPARLAWHAQWWTKFRRAQDRIKEQDRVILEGLGPIEESRQHENLIPSDIGVVHLRRRLNRAYAESQGLAVSDAPAGAALPVRGHRPYAAWELEP
jgi:phenylpropionate dioxygenase-like ring-hydroxylating dioxygenase large terminal subunit